MTTTGVWPRSAEVFERARRVTPAGVHSNSRARQPHPRYFREARGAHVWDADGNRLIDLVMGNGAVVLGHNDSRVQDAVRAMLERGLTCGVEWEGAADVAEAFLRVVPTMDLVRFANTGTEAVTHALHVARHATGRARLAKAEGSYHGWSDELFVSAFPDISRAGGLEAPASLPGSPGLHGGAVESTLVLPFNDVARTRALVEAHTDELAAVILEPVLIDTGYIPATVEYLQMLREVCTKHGIVLIFDEILTGFRLAPGGAQAYYGVVPDLATFGKAMANGYPLAALAGREDLMRLTEPGNGPAFVGTFNGHAVPLAAAAATLPLLADGSVQRTLTERVRRLAASFAAAALAAGVEVQLCGGGADAESADADAGRSAPGGGSAAAGAPSGSIAVPGGGGHFQWYFTGADVTDYRAAVSTNAARYAAFAAKLGECGLLVSPKPISHHAISLAHDEAVLEQMEGAFRAGLEAAAGAR